MLNLFGGLGFLQKFIFSLQHFFATLLFLLLNINISKKSGGNQSISESDLNTPFEFLNQILRQIFATQNVGISKKIHTGILNLVAVGFSVLTALSVRTYWQEILCIFKSSSIQ